MGSGLWIPVAILVALAVYLLVVLVKSNRAMDMSLSAADEAKLLARKSIELQEEANRILGEIRDELRARGNKQ